jgi:hypothetical protein
MKISNKKHISLTVEDVKDLLIKQLYHFQGISGIFDVKFKIINKPIGTNTRDSMDHWVFDGAEITVDLNDNSNR